MLDENLSKIKADSYKFVIITLDSHSAGPVSRVQAKLKPFFPTLEITVHAAAEWAENPSSLDAAKRDIFCLLYTSPSPRDATLSRMPSSA